jgi:DNA-binding transcriptional regulator YiaG
MKADLKRQEQIERATGRINSALTRYRQPALEEVTPPPYDVSKVDRTMSRPPVFAPVKALVRNVQHKRSADERGAVTITPADFKAWRENHLQMTGDELAALIRVNARTINGWENGRSRIPFAMYWVMKHLQPADLPAGFDVSKPTKYAPVEVVDNGSRMLERILKRYDFVMREQGVTAADFKAWRTLTMMMSQHQLAQLVRVPVKMVMDWESGKATIPFSMWWVMHSTLQDPETFLTRPGFHNFYIDYYNDEPMICSRTHPDIRYTITDLYVGRVAYRPCSAFASMFFPKEWRWAQSTCV